MKLTDQQEKITKEILNTMDSGVNRVVLTGGAGSGKTTLMKEFIESFRKRKYQYGNIFTTAPTHKALSVLKSKIGTEKEIQSTKNEEENIGKYIVFNTIHSALKLKREIDKKTGRISFIKDKGRHPIFDKCDLLIIDESSMLDEPTILKNLEDFKFPILFVGDEKQIQPVNYSDSPVFGKGWKTFELTEIIRQGKGNPIIDLSRNLEWLSLKEDNMDGIGYLYDNDRKKIITRLAEVNGTDEYKYLAYRNKEVDLMNIQVRERLYGSHPSLVQTGESIILNAPFLTHYTNEEIKIESIDIIEKGFSFLNIKYVFKVYFVNDELSIIHEDSRIKYERVVKQIENMIYARQCDWTDYYDFIEQFTDFTYNHALTIHKSLIQLALIKPI